MPKRILVVDDNGPIRGLVREFIESRPGFEICGEAADGMEGVQKGRELKPDLIVLDFLMPRINGLQAALILHEIEPSTPIILFTFYKNAIPMGLGSGGRGVLNNIKDGSTRYAGGGGSKTH